MIDLALCPHCWHRFAPKDATRFSSPPYLAGSPNMGQNAPRRSQETDLDASDPAIDRQRELTRRLACPNCHLELPQACLEMRAINLSIVGAHAVGNSLFLRTSTSRLESVLPKHFGLIAQSVADEPEHLGHVADSLTPGSQSIATDLSRESSNAAELAAGGGTSASASARLLAIAPKNAESLRHNREGAGRIVCLHSYDGEHFSPGQSSGSATRLMALSNVVVYLFDPIADPRIRHILGVAASGRAMRQEYALLEFINRIREHRGLSRTEQLPMPLVVAVTNSDHLNRFEEWSSGLAAVDVSAVYGSLNIDLIQAASRVVREFVSRYSRDALTAAESGFREVTYIPVSSIDHAVQRTGSSEIDGPEYSPRVFSTDVPLLYAIHQVAPGLIRARRSKAGASSVPDPAGRSADVARHVGRDRSASPLSPKSVQPAAASGGRAAQRDRTAGFELPRPVTDQVHFSLTAPTIVAAGHSYVLDVWVHLAEQRDEVLARARECVGGEFSVRSKGGVPLERGTVLIVQLAVSGLEVGDPEDIVRWNGDVGNATFPVTVPAGAASGPRNGTVRFYANSIPIAKLHFSLEVGEKALPPARLAASERRYRSAFASYASPDRNNVLARIQGMQKVLPQLDVFLDVASLRSGEDWSQRLEQEISHRDVLYLFWSQHAQRSKWVEYEWRTAFRLHGIRGVNPIPLVPPEEAPPPPELGEVLHFNDWILAYMRGCGDSGIA